MKSSRFYFDLPKELIAQYPDKERGDSRLLVYNRKEDRIIHTFVKNFPDFINKDTVLVFNNTRVRKARIFGLSEYGGKTEFLLLSQISSHRWTALCSKAKRQNRGKTFIFPDNLKGRIAGEKKNGKILEFDRVVDDSYLEKNGHVPLPPYIRREDNTLDCERYQTVYSKITGSAAAPTAGLHFTENIIKNIKETGAEICFITLHVGQGTFQPIRTDEIEDHVMHEESYEISEKTADILNSAKKAGKKIMTIGTTSLRAIESSGGEGKILPGYYKTSLYIYPGYFFKQADQLFTNFHTPDSTLLLLVSAFAGTDQLKKLYTEAINRKYRFFSYGDAMCVL